MYLSTGFFQDDLNVFYTKRSEESMDMPSQFEHADTNVHLYRLVFIVRGDFCIDVHGKRTNLFNGDMVLRKPNEELRLVRLSKNDYEFMAIDFHASAFIGLDEDFLDAFMLPDQNDKTFHIGNFKDSTIKQLFMSLIRCVKLHCSRAHIHPRVQAILSEVSLYYNEKFGDAEYYTNSIPVRIMNYINKHYTEKISFETIKEKFYVSFPTVNEIVIKNTGMTFWEYITSIRLEYAHRILHDSSISASKAASFVGFNNYSTFYRAYKKKYGVAPTSEKLPKKYPKWPLT